MKRTMVILLCITSITLLFTVCSNNEKAIQNKPIPWSQSEIDNLFDLTELGKITHNGKGEWFAAGRPFDFNYVQGLDDIGYGREMNLLGLDDEVYASMKPEIANALYLANGNTLRSELERYGLSVRILNEE